MTIIEDTREQKPLDFSRWAADGITCERGKLRTGDYAFRGYEPYVFIERKSLPDLVSTLTHGRERFMREIYDRATFRPVRFLVVEAHWGEIARPYDFSLANPKAILHTLYSLMLPPVGLHVIADGRREMLAWHIVNIALNVERRAKSGSRGVWRSIFADDSADLAAIPGGVK